MVHLHFRHSTSRATLRIVSRCAITDEISTLTNNKNGFVGDNGGGGTTASKRRPRHRNAFVYHPIKGWYERQVWRRGDRRRRQRWDNDAVGYTSEMEAGPMVDESWQQRKCDGLVLFAIRYYKYNLQNQH